MANPTNITIGYNAKIKINGTLFGIRSGTATIEADEHEVGDTNTGVQKTHAAGRESLSLDLKVYEDSTVDYFGGTFTLRPRTTVAVLFYPNGLAGGVYTCTTFLVLRAQHAIDVTNPNDLSFAGKNAGAFTSPSGA